MKILFLPFLQLATGHHQVADALIRSLRKRLPEATLKKVDFLSYVDQRLEKMVATTYLKWIDHAPESYDKVYRYLVYPSRSTKHLQWYGNLFSKKMLHMLHEERPDLIVCTHALPSYLVARLKERGQIQAPTVNVYTDFFVNNFWGRFGIDYHCVPDNSVKSDLMRSGIPESRIFVTGIPVDECFVPVDKQEKVAPPYRILVAGGNSGLGSISGLLRGIGRCQGFEFLVLCGQNKRLFDEISSWDTDAIRPLSYISSRKQMNDLYNAADAIITKPGGVTVSEALTKKLPIFVHSTLPGQEEFNHRYLTLRGLVIPLKSDRPIPEQLLNFLSDPVQKMAWRENVNEHHRSRPCPAWETILNLIGAREAMQVKEVNEQ